MKNITFEISQLKNLNFTIENEILKIDYFIKYTKEKIQEYKKMDFIREEKRDIHLNSKNEIYNIEQQLNMKILNLRKELEEMIFQEEQDKKEIEIIKEKLEKYKDIYSNGKYDKKYINESKIIEEDKNEDITKSLNNFTNSFVTNTKKEDLMSFDSNERDFYKINKGNLMILDNFILKKNNLENKEINDDKNSDSNTKNLNVNMNINLNINVNHNENKIIKNNYIEDNKKKNNYKNIPKIDIPSVKFNSNQS